MSEVEAKSLNALKQYSSALANGGEAESLAELLTEYRELWLPQKNYGHGITMGFLAGLTGLNERAEQILKRPSRLIPTNLMPDLELAKIHLANENVKSTERVLRRAYMRSKKANIGVLKAYTSFLFNNKRLRDGARLLSDYKSLWRKQKKSWRAAKGPLTVDQQRQRNAPYGHGLESPITTPCWMKWTKAEQTLASLIDFVPSAYGADAELYLLLKKNLNRMKDARTLITSAYERGGKSDTGIVVKYAGMLRAFGETQQALAVLEEHQPQQNQLKDYLFSLGDILVELNQPEAAREHLAQLVQLVPEVVDFRVAYAKCLQKIPAVDDAVAVLKEAIAAQPDQLGPDIALSKNAQ